MNLGWTCYLGLTLLTSRGKAVKFVHNLVIITLIPITAFKTNFQFDGVFVIIITYKVCYVIDFGLVLSTLYLLKSNGPT